MPITSNKYAYLFVIPKLNLQKVFFAFVCCNEETFFH